MRKIVIMICIILIILLGVFIGFRIAEDEEQINNTKINNNLDVQRENIESSLLEIASQEEKTTPNTLIIYRTYYTKCKHYVQEYIDIDVSLVNKTEKEFKERYREWKIDKFSSAEVEMSKELESFCNQHYKIILENNVIVIYSIDEDGSECQYEQTGITTEYLTGEDILKLTTGIYVYGKENLTSTIEDYY